MTLSTQLDRIGVRRGPRHRRLEQRAQHARHLVRVLELLDVHLAERHAQRRAQPRTVGPRCADARSSAIASTR